MLNIIFYSSGLFLIIAYGLGYLTRIEFKTQTNQSIIIFWIMSILCLYYYDVPGIHLLYVYPLSVVLAFIGLRLRVRFSSGNVFRVSFVLWCFILIAVSDFFGTFS